MFFFFFCKKIEINFSPKVNLALTHTVLLNQKCTDTIEIHKGYQITQINFTSCGKQHKKVLELQIFDK